MSCSKNGPCWCCFSSRSFVRFVTHCRFSSTLFPCRTTLTAHSMLFFPFIHHSSFLWNILRDRLIITHNGRTSLQTNAIHLTSNACMYRFSYPTYTRRHYCIGPHSKPHRWLRSTVSWSFPCGCGIRMQPIQILYSHTTSQP